jgi:hypothetical protein
MSSQWLGPRKIPFDRGDSRSNAIALRHLSYTFDACVQATSP